MPKKRAAISTVAILSLLALLIVLIFFNPYSLSSTIEFTAEHIYLGAFLLITLRTIAVIVPAIPAGMVSFAAVPILGWFVAFICNTTGILLGTSIAFFLARIYREPLVTRFAPLNKINKFGKQVSGKKEFMAILALRLFTVPVVDISSYAIGLTKISYKKFLLATFLATLPNMATFYFGEEVYRRIFGKRLFVGVISILIIGSIYFIIKRYKTKFNPPAGRIKLKI